MQMPEAGFGVLPLEQARTMDGLSLMQGIRDGRLPGAPIAKTLGFWVSEVEAGRVVFSYEPVADHFNDGLQNG